jgi:long-chain acyl-CoA synthetase
MNKLKKLTLLEVLNSSSKNFPENICVSVVNSPGITYREFKEKVDSVSSFLKSEGIIAGDKVAILSENMPNWGIAYFAITTIGAIAVPVMTEFSSTEVHHVLRHSESKAIFISAKQFNKIDDLEDGQIQTRVLIDDFSVIPAHTKQDLIKEVLTSGKKEFAKIKEAALKLVGLIPDTVEEDTVALILYTSGTTGHSKGVMLTHKNVVSDAISTTQMVEINQHTRMLSVLPLFHTMESTLGLVIPFMAGGSVTYIDKPPTAAVLLPALLKVRPTVMLVVPLLIEKIYKQKVLPEINKKALVRGLYKLPMIRKSINKMAGRKLMHTFGGELKMCCIGGASLAADVERFLKEAGFPYAIGYGLTETAPLVAGTNPQGVRLRSTGKALPGMQLMIDNPDPKNGEGEILIKSPSVMKGYFKDPEKTKEVFTPDGWFRSGDQGVIDKDGYLFIKGRSKNVIIGPNGKNIYPEEIESIINESKYVLESLVLQRDGKLIARVFLNSDEIDQELRVQKISETHTREVIDKLLADLLTHTNLQVNSFSRLNKIIEQREPFEKTPTQKIKRYLYVD